MLMLWDMLLSMSLSLPTPSPCPISFPQPHTKTSKQNSSSDEWMHQSTSAVSPAIHAVTATSSPSAPPKSGAPLISTTTPPPTPPFFATNASPKQHTAEATAAPHPAPPSTGTPSTHTHTLPSLSTSAPSNPQTLVASQKRLHRHGSPPQTEMCVPPTTERRTFRRSRRLFRVTTRIGDCGRIPTTIARSLRTPPADLPMFGR